MKWITCPSDSSCAKCLKVAFETGDDFACLNQKWTDNNCAFEGNFMNGGGARVFVSSQLCLIDGNLEMIQVTLSNSSVSMAERSRAYVYDCCGVIKTSPRLNLLPTYEKEILPNTKTQ